MTARDRQAMALAAALASVLAAAAFAPTNAAAQTVHPGEQSWLGLRGADIPQLLKTAAADPYKAPAAPMCETIPAELLALDEVLGPETAAPSSRRADLTSFAVRQAKGAVRGLIPYRGAIRFLTGADHKDHELMTAAQAGWARRGFLRGLEANLHCAGGRSAAVDADAPEPPPALTVAAARPTRIPTAFQPPPRTAAGDLASPAGETAVRLDVAAVTLDTSPSPGADGPGR